MGGKSPTGGRENPGFADLRADLDFNAGLACEFSNGQAAGNTAALGDSNVEMIASAKLD